MEVVDDVHECFAPFAPLFSYMVSTEEVIVRLRTVSTILRLCNKNAPSTITNWSLKMARPKLPLVRETSRPIFADARDSAFLSDANALARCFTICVREKHISLLSTQLNDKDTHTLCRSPSSSLGVGDIPRRCMVVDT